MLHTQQRQARRLTGRLAGRQTDEQQRQFIFSHNNIFARSWPSRESQFRFLILGFCVLFCMCLCDDISHVGLLSVLCGVCERVRARVDFASMNARCTAVDERGTTFALRVPIGWQNNNSIELVLFIK